MRDQKSGNRASGLDKDIYWQDSTMIVKELLEKVNFDSLVPILDKLMAHRTPLSQAAYFRMAYDEMLQMEPSTDVNPLEVRRGEDGHLNGSSGHDLEGDFWENSLGREIRLSDGPEISDEELAAHLLWSMTFYCFSEKYRDRNYPEISDAFDDKILNIYQKRLAAYAHIPLKQAKKMNVDDDEYFVVEEQQLKNMTRRNRAKRMRDHRHQQAIKKYERMNKVKATIESILRCADDYTEEQFAYLYDTKLISDNCYYSYAADNSHRLDYIFDLIRKYGNNDYSSFDSLVLFVTTDKDLPLSDDELNKLTQFAKANEPWRRYECGYAVEEGFGDGAVILIVASRDL